MAMKVRSSWRVCMLAVTCLGGLGGVACNKADDPEAIDIKNLKYASDLKILDNGDGSVRLTWRGANFEEDFQGYNIYGMKMTDETIATLASKGLEKGKPLQLIDAAGAARADAKEVLAEFNYNGTDINSKKADEPADASSTERKFSYLPIHKKATDGTTPVLPTCYPDKDAASKPVCKATTVEVDDRSLNGSIYFDLTGLSIGSQYCFLIFSVKNGGKEISQSSANFECVIPRKSVNLTMALSGVATTSQEVKLREIATACAASTGCPDVSATTATAYSTYVPAAGATSQTSSSTGAIYFEAYGTAVPYYIVTGAHCGIKDYGYRSGFSDGTLPNESEIPKFSNEYSTAASATQNSNNYDVAGQSIRLVAKNMYLVACRDTVTTSKVYYHWLYVNGSTDPARTSTSESFSLRMALTSR